MRIRKIMSEPVISITSEDAIIKAADLMRRHAIGILPVLESWCPVGVITDRDIVIRAVADPERTLDQPVRAVMSPDPISCQADQTIAEAAAVMGDEQVRRVLVLDRSEHLVGVLTVGDIAREVSEELAGQVLGEIVEFRKNPDR